MRVSKVTLASVIRRQLSGVSYRGDEQMTGQRRSTRLAAVVGIALAATLAMAACSSDDNADKTNTSGSNTSSSSSQPASSSFDEAAAKAEITAQYTTLYDGTKDLETKLQTI